MTGNGKWIVGDEREYRRPKNCSEAPRYPELVEIAQRCLALVEANSMLQCSDMLRRDNVFGSARSNINWLATIVAFPR